MSIQNLDFTDSEVMLSALHAAVAYIKRKILQRPSIGLILDVGQGNFARQLQKADSIPCGDIPFFPQAAADPHGGCLYVGELGGKCLLVLQGRGHYYEGYDTQMLALPVRAMKLMGIESVIITGACSGVSKHFAPGELMVLEDHLSHLCPNPLRGAWLEELSPRFVDAGRVYTPEYVQLALACAQETYVKAQKGVYGFWPGPTRENAAEVRAFMALGADAVGMSTVPEAITAAACGMKVMGISYLTGMACGYNTGGGEDADEAGLKAAGSMMRLLTKIIEKM